jgi:prepilin-type N-terminal cleavage/methylation domain-containing protein
VEYSRKNSGFTIIEVLVSLVLVGGLVLILSTLVLPLQINRSTNIETQGIAFARSYLEIIKSRWQVRSGTTGFLSGATSLPTWSDSLGTADVKVPTGWKIEVDTTSWSSSSTLRTVTVVVKPANTDPGSPEKWIKLETKIIAPS